MDKRPKYVSNNERKYRFSLIRGVIKFIPYGILLLFTSYYYGLKNSISGYKPQGTGIFIFIISLCGIIWLGRGEQRPKQTSIKKYVPRPDKVVDDTSEESECLRCGAKIPPGMSSCKSCGWSYYKV